MVAAAVLAKHLAPLGVDAVIAEGTESGGHVGEMTTMALVPQVIDAVSVPVVAAGGIADGRQAAAAFALGACGIQVGTCLLASEECPIHPNYKQAVLKAKDASGLTVMELGDSDNLTIGEWVMTLGSPFGLEQSVATGIVSATSRSQIMSAQESMQSGGTGEVTIYPNMIQTDAAINPGNSGGALVDDEGKLIGINTLITSYSGNYSGVGFAIPVNYAINLAQQIIAGETPTHAQLGVSLSTVSAATASRYGLPVDTGAYVAAVTPDSGAAAAGIVPGDIVTAFDGQAVESASDLMLDVRTKNPGDTVTLTVNSGGQEKEVQVTLGDDSASQKAKQEQQSQEQSMNGYSLEALFGGRQR